MFNTQGTNTQEGGISKFIKPGVYVCRIKGFEYIESKNGTPGVEITFESSPVEGLTDDNGNSIGQIAIETMWLSDKAWSFTMGNNREGGTKVRLAIIADKLGVREELDNIKAGTPKEYVEATKPLFKGKTARWAFGGEEIAASSADKINWVKSFLLPFKFVESIEEVPNSENTTLVYDKTNSYHYKALNNTSAIILNNDNEGDDLPWD